MRKGLLIVGVILLVLGIVLAFVPLVTQSVSSTESSGTSTGSYVYVWNNNGVILPATVKVSWTAPDTTEFFYFSCTNSLSASTVQSTSFNLTQQCNGLQTYGASSVTSGGQTINYDTGTSASQSISVPAGGTLIFGGVPASGSETISITATYPEPLFGLILIILGVLLAVVGVVLKAKRKGPKVPKGQQPPPQQWGPQGQQPVQAGPPQYWQQPQQQPGQWPPQQPGPWQQPPPGQWPPPQQ